MEKVSTLGIDLAKNVFQVHGADQSGKKLFNKKISRDQLMPLIDELPKADNFMVAMEACGGAHHIARCLKSKGIDGRLIAPQFIKPFVKARGRSKTDAIDVSAIATVARLPETHFVGIKTVEHQDIQALHRVREKFIKERTGIANTIRGLLLERGFTVPQGIFKLIPIVPEIIKSGDKELTEDFKSLLEDLYEELIRCFKKTREYDKKLEKIYNQDRDCQRLGEIEGVGVITATAVVSAVGDVRVFKNSRQFSSWLGLTPREHSTGGKQRLLGISKRGDRYIRKNLVHGCRSVVHRLRHKSEELLENRGQWIKIKLGEKGSNKTSVALANKTARTIWALLSRRDDVYKSSVYKQFS